ncbi:hypothetical protein RB195_013526 [Necator americanus]|uniref:Uncharacterized protein n=1 Tax=Necator americanus TaxID=51031 RepID=A0ABR1DWK1_NECAM
MKEELNRRMRAACTAFVPVREATDQLTDLRAHPLDSTVLSGSVTQRRLGQTHTTASRSSQLQLKRKVPSEYVSKAKHRWASHIMRRIDDRWTKRTLEWILKDAKRPRERPPSRWGDVFATRMDQLTAQLDTAQGPRHRHSRNFRTF